MLSFIITVFILIGLFYLFRFIGPYLFRYLIKKLISDFSAKENFEKQEKEKKNNPSDRIGEYIDYEEID